MLKSQSQSASRANFISINCTWKLMTWNNRIWNWQYIVRSEWVPFSQRSHNTDPLSPPCGHAPNASDCRTEKRRGSVKLKQKQKEEKEERGRASYMTVWLSHCCHNMTCPSCSQVKRLPDIVDAPSPIYWAPRWWGNSQRIGLEDWRFNFLLDWKAHQSDTFWKKCRWYCNTGIRLCSTERFSP